MTRCTFNQGNYNCGSYAFNLWKESIEQGSYCDHHYWQDRAEKVRAEEREACALVCINIANKPSNVILGVAINCADAIRSRGNT